MLIAFDFDGTLSDSEMTVLLGERHGVGTEMARITERAMNDEISYAESLRKRAELLAGLSEAQVKAAFQEVELRPETADVLQALNDAGHSTAILTGGFSKGVKAALQREGVTVDQLVANTLPIKNGALSGEVEGPLIEGTKDEALADLASSLGISLEETVAVGDGANDLPMLRVAELSVGYTPKEAVEPHCDKTVSSMAELQSVLVETDVLDGY